MTFASITEQLHRSIETLTIDPFKNVAQYFFPFIAPFFSGHQKLSSDPALEALMPSKPTELMLREIKNLTDCAQISREVIPYVALNHRFSSSGGFFSLTNPILMIPEQHLFRRDSHSPFPQEKPDENLAKNRWIFSDDEVRFFIARELGQIKESSTLLKVAIKIAILMSVFTIYGTSFGLLAGSILFIGAIGLYIFSERHFQARADLLALKILSQRISNAKEVAIQALEKELIQNLYRRENSSIARLFILESGNNLLDFMHPFLTTRIERLKNCEKNF